VWPKGTFAKLWHSDISDFNNQPPANSIWPNNWANQQGINTTAYTCIFTLITYILLFTYILVVMNHFYFWRRYIYAIGRCFYPKPYSDRTSFLNYWVTILITLITISCTDSDGTNISMFRECAFSRRVHYRRLCTVRMCITYEVYVF